MMYCSWKKDYKEDIVDEQLKQFIKTLEFTHGKNFTTTLLDIPEGVEAKRMKVGDRDFLYAEGYDIDEDIVNCIIRVFVIPEEGKDVNSD